MSVIVPESTTSPASAAKGAQELSGLGHRTDIDGLRAVAVMLVVLFHLGFLKLPGGFVGVDIFFVISGFLITGIIQRDLLQGRFHFTVFYSRRIRRIAPALVCVLGFSSAASVLFLLPDELVKFGYSLAAAALSYSNFFFWTQSDYFTQDFGKILLHTWSLAVEEQFYVFWPVALWIAHRRKWPLLPTILGVMVVSLGLAEYLVLHGNRSMSFYFPMARAWELLAGCILALTRGLNHLSRKWREPIALFGATLMVGSGLFFGSRTPFPGVSALVPCLGAVLIIAVGPSATWTSRVLSLRPLQWIGLISYSVYLWHWPLVVLCRRGALVGVDISSPGGKLLLLSLSLLLGWASWRFVEQPFRSGHPQRMGHPGLFKVYGGVLSVLIVTGIAFVICHGLPNRFPRPALTVASYGDTSRGLEGQVGPCQLSGNGRFQDFDKERCLKVISDRRNVLLIGDSHAGALWWGLQGELPNVHLLEATVTYGCMFTIGNYDRSPCGQMRRYTFESFLIASRVDEVILTESWTKPESVVPFAPTFEWFRGHGIRLTVIGPVPEYKAPLPLLLAMAIKKGEPSDLSSYLLPSDQIVDSDLGRDASVYDYKYISAYESICGKNACRVYADDEKRIPILRDTGHLTNAGASWLVNTWVKDGILNDH